MVIISPPKPSPLMMMGVMPVHLRTSVNLPLHIITMANRKRKLNLLMIRKRRISRLRLFDTDLRRKNKAGLSPSTLNEAQQRGRQYPRDHRTSLHGEALGPEVADGEADVGLAAAGSERRAPGAVLGKVHADDADAAGLGRQRDRAPQHNALVRLQRVVHALEAHAVARPRHPVRRRRQDLLHRVALREVDGRRADGPRLLEPFRHVVDAEHFRCPAEEGAVRTEEADWTCLAVSADLVCCGMRNSPAPKTATLSPG